MHHVEVIGLFGFLGLLSVWRPVPAGRPGGLVRALGLGGLVGLAGLWSTWLGACGAFGALGLWNHPSSIRAVSHGW